jgi:hypothetical protein
MIDQLPAAYEECTITAKQYDGDSVAKVFACGTAVVVLNGKQQDQVESGKSYHSELGYLSYENRPFGEIPKSADQFYGCVSHGNLGNYAGYMTEERDFVCSGVHVALRGHWGSEYQGNWDYHLSLGEINTEPMWVDDPKKMVDFTSGFQKWCPTALGYKLCGWIDEPKVDHGQPPPFVKD